jgi:hypothetical protein
VGLSFVRRRVPDSESSVGLEWLALPGFLTYRSNQDWSEGKLTRRIVLSREYYLVIKKSQARARLFYHLSLTLMPFC